MRVKGDVRILHQGEGGRGTVTGGTGGLLQRMGGHPLHQQQSAIASEDAFDKRQYEGISRRVWRGVIDQIW